LVEAMKNLDMIETQGGGIRKYLTFKTTIFPLPDYNFDDNKVKVLTKVLDENFARILIKKIRFRVRRDHFIRQSSET
jgi:ATP-dependent DNA helicase RecG